MLTKQSTRIVDIRGRRIPLTVELGRGGEGGIFEIGDRPDLVAKIYAKKPDAEKSAKLRIMIGLQSERLLKLAAWPIETLQDSANGDLVGFLMPKISNHKDIHALYSPKNRLMQFPEADWRFLIASAANVARAFAVVHEHGQVIGDVNHGNVLVSQRAMARLIDCDSFQVVYQGQRYLCEVGVPTHTPPELQGKPLRDVLRTVNHDAFGLAILVFQLLFLGRHPFSGSPVGSGDIPLEKAISEFRFAYGERAATRKMRQPPATLPLAAVTASLAGMFERAFSPEGAGPAGRPTPSQWAAALDQLGRELTKCMSNAAHHYPRNLKGCPWCDIERQARITLFKVYVSTASASTAAFDLTAIWSQIAGVHPPPPLPPLPTAMPAVPTGLQASLAGRKRRRWRTRAIGGVVAIIIVLASLSPGAAALVWSTSAAVVLAFIVDRWGSNDSRALRNRERTEQIQAISQRDVLAQQWRWEAGDARFLESRRNLEEKRRELQSVPAMRQAKLQKLVNDRQAPQLQIYLNRCRIDPARVSGIGPVRAATLSSCGIKTAAESLGRRWRLFQDLAPQSRLI